MVPAIRRIAVGVGLLGRWDPVLRIALGLAKELQAELHAVHVYDPPHPLEVAYAERTGRGASALEERSTSLAALLEEQIRGFGEAAGAVCHVREGTPSEGIVEVAAQVEADLVIVGATRQDRVSRRFLGSTAQGVISAAVAPVLLLRQPVVRPLRRVLVTTNLSEVSNALCRKGLALAGSLFPPDEPQLRCLLVLQRPAGDAVAAAADPLLEFARAELTHFLADQGCALDGVQERIRAGEAAEEIVDEVAAWAPNLLILGSHGYSGRIHGIGSVTGQVLREVACNALVVPAAEARRRQLEGAAGAHLRSWHPAHAAPVQT